MATKVVGIEDLDGDDLRITVESKFLWFRPRIIHYVGGCTVWHREEGGRLVRASTLTESWLADVWDTYRHNMKRRGKR